MTITADLVSSGLYFRQCERRSNKQRCANHRYIVGLFIPDLDRKVDLCPAHFAEAQMMLSSGVVPTPVSTPVPTPVSTPVPTPESVSPQIEVYILETLAKSKAPMSIRQIWLSQTDRARDTIAGAIRRLVGYGYAEVVSGKGHSHDPFMYVITDSGRLQLRLSPKGLPRAPR